MKRINTIHYETFWESNVLLNQVSEPGPIFTSPNVWSQIPIPYTSCVTWDKLLNHPGSPFPHKQSGDNNGHYYIKWL